MSQPTPYTPTTDFSQQEANNASGRSTVNTAALDAEFAALQTTLEQTLANIELLQRDDGKLADVIVETRCLAPDVLNLIGGLRLTGLWLQDTDYAVNDICSNGEYTYVCKTAHNSGSTFDAQYWVQFGFTAGADAAQAAANAQASANAAASSATTASNAATTATNAATAAAGHATTASNAIASTAASAASASTSATNAANSATAAQVAAASVDTSTFCQKANNLSDLANKATARTNLGVSIGVDVQAYDANTAKTNADQSWTGSHRATPTTDNDLSFDMAAAMDFLCTPTAGGALTFTNIAQGQRGCIYLVNGSNYAITAAASTKVTSTLLASISATGEHWLSYWSPDGSIVLVTAAGDFA